MRFRIERLPDVWIVTVSTIYQPSNSFIIVIRSAKFEGIEGKRVSYNISLRVLSSFAAAGLVWIVGEKVLAAANDRAPGSTAVASLRT